MKSSTHALACALAFVCMILTAVSPAWAEDEQESERTLLPMAAQQDDDAQQSSASAVAQTYGLDPVLPNEYNGDLRDLSQVTFRVPRYYHMLNEFEEPEGYQPPVTQRPETLNIGFAAMPAPLTNFAGLGFSDAVTGGEAGAGWPPDVNGDVGPTVYIQAVNDAYAIYNKSTGARLAAFTEDSLWAASGSSTPCNGNNDGDPVVLHDAVADRWILTNFAFAFNASGAEIPPFYQCFAVSKTSDPVSGGWYLYAVQMDPGGTGLPPAGTLNDYGKFGIWTDCLYMGANGFNSTSGSYVGAIFASFSKTAMYAGSALTSSIGFISATNNPFSMFPANLLGTSAASMSPAGTPEYFISESNAALRFEVRKFTAGAGCGAGGSISAATNVSQTSYTRPGQNIVPQPGTTNTLDSLGDRLMQKVQYRKIGSAESLWVVHSTRTSATSTVGQQWAQIDVSGGTIAATPVQQQIYADTTLYRWLGSLAVDNQGNMAVGYSLGNGTSPNFPSIAYSGRLVGDPLNNLPQTETILQAGAGFQKFGIGSLSSTLIQRWGDYSAMSVDPTDDCTFWYTNEYYDTQSNGNISNWQTRIGSFKFPSCGTAVSTFTIGGNINGLTGSIGLKLDGTGPTSTQTQTFSANGSFTFGTALASGSNWTVSVATQPTGQTCTITNGSGTNLIANVTTVAVSCTTNTFTIGGNISGLTGSVGLKLDGTGPASTQTQTFSTNGGFTFSTPLNSGSNWSVSVATQPTGQTCTVTNGTGANLLANVTTVSVSCTTNTFTIGGNINGLTGPIGLKLDGTGPTSTQTQTFSANGGFTFGTALASGSNWAVSVATQPTGQTCVVTNGSGTNLLANVTTVAIACTTNKFTIGGSIGSLNGSVQLKLDGTSPASTQTQTFSTNGGFTFSTPLNSGSNWTVSVATQPNGQTCIVTNGTGTNLAANVTTVTVACSANTFTLTYSADPNGSIVGISPQTVTFGSSGTAVTAVPNAGYHFMQWSDASTANPRTDTNVTADISVTASFALNQLVFTTQPADLTNGQALGIVVVTEQDGSGNTVLDNSSVDFSSSACGGSLDLGSVTMVNGVATLTSAQRFYTATSTPGLQINATTGLLSGTSQFFNVLSNPDLVFADAFEDCRP